MATMEPGSVPTKAAGRRAMIGQLVRYGINGLIVTGIQSGIYAGLARGAHWPLQLCNFAGYVVAVCTGYMLHSRVTFRGHGQRGRGAQVRFVLASLPGYALNSFWVWLLATMLHLPNWTPVVLFVTVTPIMLFAINRWWVFR